MQLKISKQLNKLLGIMLASMLLLLFGIYYFSGEYPDLKWVFIGSFVIVGMIMFILFKWLENRWDKTVITKMASSGKVALANIKTAKQIMPMRDSGFTSYWLYEFEAELYDPKTHNKIEKTFYEKMSKSTTSIPKGSVYVTYDEKKPNQIFIVPNVLLSHLPQLASIVSQYERDEKIKIKYLNAYYDKGMVVETFRKAIKEEREKKKKTLQEME